MTKGTPDSEGRRQFQASSSADVEDAKKFRLLSRIHTFDSLSIRDFRLLWLGQVDTSLGQWMDNISRTYLIYHITNSAFQLGLAAAARGIPLFLFGIVAGALADRSSRKTQLIVAQVTNAVLNFILATLVLMDRVQPWHVYVTGFLVGTVQAFQNPARQTLVSDLAGRRHIINALALNSMALNTSRALGPALAGLLIATVGVHGSYYVQAVMFLLATVWTIQMHVPKRGRESAQVAREPLLKSIKGGFDYVRANSSIRAQLILALGPLTLAMPFTNMMPIFARDVLHGGAQLQGLLLSAFGVGSLLGALIVASIPRQRAYALPAIIGAVVFSFTVFLFGSSQWVWLSLTCAFFSGIFMTTYQTQDQALLQLSAPSHIRGRVMSFYLMNRATIPIGTLLAGALAHYFGGPAAVRMMSLAAVGVIFLVIAKHPAFVRLNVDLQESDATALLE
ncbi:MAG TPA: MFS transporter [Candidatus Acidoferrales bacterium]|nr:MFS transporter [Candidatus Acidoferrales bacterium]